MNYETFDQLHKGEPLMFSVETAGAFAQLDIRPMLDYAQRPGYFIGDGM